MKIGTFTTYLIVEQTTVKYTFLYISAVSDSSYDHFPGHSSPNVSSLSPPYSPPVSKQTKEQKNEFRVSLEISSLPGKGELRTIKHTFLPFPAPWFNHKDGIRGT